MSLKQPDPSPTRLRAAAAVIWRFVQVAVAVAVVVVPFAYAATGVHREVLIAAGCSLAMAIGLSLRLGPRSGRSSGILIGSAVGILLSLVAAVTEGTLLFVVPPAMAPLALGLIDGLGPARLSGYRETSIVALTVAVLLGLGFLPGIGLTVFLFLLYAPQNAIIAGYFNRNREGRLHSRPPVWLLLPFLAAVVANGWIGVSEGGWLHALVALPLIMVVGPAAFFLSARAFAIWMKPRLDVYVQLVEYFRVMWIPIGGFSAGYLAIIVVFAGFSGMLERFSPGSFAGAADAGIGDWLSFSFYSALAQDYTGITPASLAARTLVGARLLLSVAWALVVFAAIMSAIQPQLERIARRNAQPAPGDEQPEP